MDRKQLQQEAKRLMDTLIERGWDFDDAWCAVYLNGRVEIQGQVIDVTVDDEELAAKIDALGAEAKKFDDSEYTDANLTESFPTEWELRNQATGRQDGQ